MNTNERLIIKYKNRKFYDKTNANYVNFSDILSLLNQGVAVKIVDRKTDKDITTATVLKALSASVEVHGTSTITYNDVLNLVNKNVPLVVQ